MSKHRSLSNALLTPEKLAFIKADEETKAADNREIPTINSSATTPNAAVEPIQETKSERPENALGQRSFDAANESVRTNVTRPVNDDYLVAVTTRLQARTAEALRRAYLEQKLNRREPDTQQDIIEAALQTWLRKYAFLG